MRKIYKSDASEVAFPLGGIGTGNISVDARGDLIDWEIHNTPAKGNKAHYSFFSIFAHEKGKSPVAKVLSARKNPPYCGFTGYHPGEVMGLPHMDSSTFCGEYPFVNIEFFDSSLPVSVKLETYTPFIPLNTEDSSIPGAVFRYKVKNTSENPVEVSVCATQMNLVGFYGYDEFDNMRNYEGTENILIHENEYNGIEFINNTIDHYDLRHGNIALMTKDENFTCKPKWLEGGWWDGFTDFWNEFSTLGKLSEKSAPLKLQTEQNGISPIRPTSGSLAIHRRLMPGDEQTFEFVLCWYFPNRHNGWSAEKCNPKKPTAKNYYATLWRSAKDAGLYLYNNMERLESLSRSFRSALFESTLPEEAIDALASNITVIRSTTCFMLEDGNFYGWEGSHKAVGSCDGTCTHVWNYAQTLAFLFPELERRARRIEFLHEMESSGKMPFRNQKIFGCENSDFFPAADGQTGTILRAYREWKLSGDDKFLCELWSKIKAATDFAFDEWDKDGDFVLEDKQHNTYDIEFYGANPLTSSMFFAALKAVTEMAVHLDDLEAAQKYQNALNTGSAHMDEMLWNGSYYIQKIDNINELRYQHGTGCLSDQLLGQSLAHTVGLGYILPEAHVKQAVKSIYSNNFKRDFQNHTNLQRVYALNGESGLVLCTWKDGEKPRIPFVYSDEVWTGIEYQVASHLIHEGFVGEGLDIVRAARERHDGYARNPYNEEECGNHYARSLASWSLLIALSGFKFDMTRGQVSFAPKINQGNFKTFWSTGKAWGMYTQKIDTATGKVCRNLETLYGGGVTLHEAEY